MGNAQPTPDDAEYENNASTTTPVQFIHGDDGFMCDSSLDAHMATTLSLKTELTNPFVDEGSDFGAANPFNGGDYGASNSNPFDSPPKADVQTSEYDAGLDQQAATENQFGALPGEGGAIFGAQPTASMEGRPFGPPSSELVEPSTLDMDVAPQEPPFRITTDDQSAPSSAAPSPPSSPQELSSLEAMVTLAGVVAPEPQLCF